MKEAQLAPLFFRLLFPFRTRYVRPIFLLSKLSLFHTPIHFADPRLSGNQKMDPIPELEISEDLSKVQQKLGINRSGRIKVIRKEFLLDRLEKETQYKNSLDSLLKVIVQHEMDCSRELGYVRLKHGLPSTRYPAEGYFGSKGNFIVTRPAQNNLDDAFRILAEQTHQGKKIERAEKKLEESAILDKSTDATTVTELNDG